ncbi:hypothetical protein AAMO2058_000096000 [Amorphochlora amoebiformis]|mmetsp:Transcript_21346/g.33684  ORF Transcript_21346/g.33684 Transcript_21346/m.33684 type:complete len:587 (-) Transcript_21346:39-1799(-)
MEGKIGTHYEIKGRPDIFEGAPFIGTYVDQGGQISVKDGNGEFYLYFSAEKSQWIVGLDPNSGEGWLYAEDTAPNPTMVKAVWNYWDCQTNSWKNDGEVKIIQTKGPPPPPPLPGGPAIGPSLPSRIEDSDNKRRRQNPYVQDTSRLGAGLTDIDWSAVKLVAFQKLFYQEHPMVSKMTDEEVAEFRKARQITVEGKKIPKPIRTFSESSFPPYIIEQLTKAGFKSPTGIQAQGWPMALTGRDVIGLADTGSGKTLAYLMPAIVHVNAQPLLGRGEGPIALVLAPTRELCIQIQKECEKFGKSSRLRFACVYGGVPKPPQASMLRKGAEIVIATPGRLIDFLQSRVTNLQRVTYLVLDEADRMLDLGFERFIRKICSQIRPDRQTLCFSATWPPGVNKLAGGYMENPLRVVIGSNTIHANKDVAQKVLVLEESDKHMYLIKVLEKVMDGSKILIFCKTKRTCDQVTRQLRTDGWPARCMHGDKTQSEREWVMDEFRNGKSPIMVATNIAARGLDIKGIKAVINYDFPKDIETYIHRIGRTGRAGCKGTAVSFFTPNDAMRAKDLLTVLEEAGQKVPAQLRAYARVA